MFMAREGLFNGCDAVLHWHPSSMNSAGDPTCMARIAAKFRFHGKSAHAAEAPELGRSALDAVDITTYAAQLLREHTPDFTRIHHVVTAGGSAPNVVPDFAEVFFYVRHPKSQVVKALYQRLLLCAKAGALATETELEVEYLGGTLEILPNNSLAAITGKNLRELCNLRYSKEELEFATRIQSSLLEKPTLDDLNRFTNRSNVLLKQSTDVGDVSWIVPTTGFTTACWVPGTPAHSWQAVAAGGTTIGRKGMDLASCVLAATAWDLLTQPALLESAKQEHNRRLVGQNYESLLLKNQKPPLGYRDTSTGK